MWSSVGIWRSAYWHRRRGGTPGWGLAARTLVVVSAAAILFRSGDIALRAMELGTLAAGRDSIGAIAEMKVSEDGSELALRGNLAAGAAERFEALLEASPAVREVVLTSPGGRMLEAERMAALIRKRGLDTRVEDYCMSACTDLLLAGRERDRARAGQDRLPPAQLPGDQRLRHRKADRTHPGRLSRRRREERLRLARPGHAGAGMWFPDPGQLVEANVLTGSDVLVTEGRRTASAGDRGRNAPAPKHRRDGGADQRDDAQTARSRHHDRARAASGTTLTHHYRIDAERIDAAGSRAGPRPEASPRDLLERGDGDGDLRWRPASCIRTATGGGGTLDIAITECP